jgi:protein-disulfide isomerase
MPDHNEDVPQPQHEEPTPDANATADADATGNAQPTAAVEPTADSSQPVTGRPRRRSLRIGVTAFIAIALAVAVVSTSDGGSSATPVGSNAVTQEVNSLLAGIPQSGDALGSPTAPVTMQFFGDLECSTSRGFTLNVLPAIIQDWVRGGKLRIEYRSLRTVSKPRAFSAQQVAALAAGRQDKQWYYLEDFYHEQGPERSGYVTEWYLAALAQQVPGLNSELWDHDRDDPQLAAQVGRDEQDATAAHLFSTPSLLIGRTGSAPQYTFNQSSALELTAVNEAVQQTLHNQPNPTAGA